MSNRFHNKFHRQNHHSDSTPGYPDSAMDPIASFEQPFKGEFYSQGDIITTENLSAKKYIYADDGVIHNNLTVKGNFTVLGTTSQLDTLVYTTSAVSITNTGTGPALTVTQTGSNPIAHFIDSNGDDIIFADNGYVGLGVTSPSEKLTIAGNLSSSGTATIGTIATGATNSVITQSAGILQKRDINPQVWDTTAKFVSASDGTLTVNRLTKAENNNGINESIVFDDGTNVGIGTDTPGAKLTVNGDISATGDVSTLGKFLSAGIDIATLLVGAGTDAAEVRALTGNWESTYTTVWNNSANWNAAFGSAGADVGVRALTGNWQSTYTTVQSNSANYILDGGNAKGSNLIIGTNDNFNLGLETNGSQKLTILNDGNVGIGETVPEAKLHVKNSSAGTVTAHSSSVGVFESEGHAYISLLAPDNYSSGIVMGGPGDNYAAYINWNHDNGDLKVATSHSGADIHFLVGNEVDAVRIASNGNVGIGTTSPNEKLTVVGNISAAGNHVFSSNSASDALRITQTGTGNCLVVEDSTNPDSTPFVITQSGQVITGSTSVSSVRQITTPGETLFSHITPLFQNHGGGAASSNAIFRVSENGIPASIFLNKARGTFGTSISPVQIGDSLGKLSFTGHDGENFTESSIIDAVVTDIPSVSSVKTDIRFSTANNGLTSLSEKVRFTADGNVGVGTLTPNEKLTVVGNISASGNIAAQSSTVPVSVIDLTTNKIFSNVDTNKVFHFSTSSPLTAIFPSTLSDGFSVAIMNTGTSTLHLSSNSNYKAIGDVLTEQYAGAYVYKANSELFAVGGF